MAYSAAAGLGSPPISGIELERHEAEAMRGQVGFELAGWIPFQPIWPRVRRDNLDIVD